jgi:hypothetical protein
MTVRGARDLCGELAAAHLGEGAESRTGDGSAEVLTIAKRLRKSSGG